MKLDFALRDGVRPLSRPARGAWIETFYREAMVAMSRVAPRAGRVD